MNIPFDPQPEPPGIPWDTKPGTPVEPNPKVGNCPKCGLELRQIMCYSCGNPDCPVFAHATC